MGFSVNGICLNEYGQSVTLTIPQKGGKFYRLFTKSKGGLTMKRITVLLLLSILVFVLAGCTLFGKPGTVTGKVTDHLTDAPVAGAQVTIGKETVTTNAQGAYTLNCKAGTYNLAVKKAGYFDYSKEGIVVVGGQTITENVVLVPTVGNLVGIVRDGLTNQPVSGATVTVDTKTVTSDEAGSFTVTNLAEGTHTIVVSKNGYLAAEKEFVIEGGEVNSVEVALLLTPDSTITGIITDGRGGPVVEGVTVNYFGYIAVSGADGTFKLPVHSGVTGDVIVEKTGRSSARIQDVTLTEDESVFFDIPTRANFNPNWSMVPSKINVTGVEAGDEVSGEVTFSLEVEGNHDTFVYYVYVGGEQRSPRVGFGVDVNDGTAVFDSRLWPNGPNYIKILAYDVNENVTLLYIPITINNEVTDTEIPADIPYIEAISYTFGQNLGYYKEGRQAAFERAGYTGANLLDLPYDRTLNLNAFTDNASIYNVIAWELVENADGYSVYRSADEENWAKIGDITVVGNDGYGYYYDYSSALAPMETLYYQVVPYNSFGVAATPAVIEATPLPTMNINLLTPANEATNVPLTPTLTWEFDFDLYGMGLMHRTYLHVWDNTDYKIMDVLIADDSTEYTIPGLLEPGSVYTWDIYDAYAAAAFVVEDHAFSASYTFSNSGDPRGSLNGEFIFTTTTEIEQ